jgi:hypothetical protein
LDKKNVSIPVLPVIMEINKINYVLAVKCLVKNANLDQINAPHASKALLIKKIVV